MPSNIRECISHSVPGNARSVFWQIRMRISAYPVKKRPKQQGREVIKRRRRHLAEPLSSMAERYMSEHLLTMMGMHSVQIKGRVVQITYDLLQVTAVQIEAALTYRRRGTPGQGIE